MGPGLVLLHEQLATAHGTIQSAGATFFEAPNVTRGGAQLEGAVSVSAEDAAAPLTAAGSEPATLGSAAAWGCAACRWLTTRAERMAMRSDHATPGPR